jgi:uncharacterized membrane protein
MIDLILTLKVIHVIGAAVLFGTGLGIAFFILMAHRTRDPAVIAATARIVVIADAVFTATAAIVQPLSGVALAGAVGYTLSESWIVVSIALYVLVGLCWLPVLWIQIQMRNIAAYAALHGAKLPAGYFSLFRVWFALGWPAFAAMLGIFAIMVWKPEFW